MDIHGIYENPKWVPKRASRAVLTVIEGDLPKNSVRLTHSLSVRLTPPFEDTSHVDVADAETIFRVMLEGIYFDLPPHVRLAAPLSGGVENVAVASCPHMESPKACQYVLTASLGERTIIVDGVASLVEAWTKANEVLGMVQKALKGRGWEIENRSYFLTTSKLPQPWLVRACVDQNITLVMPVPTTFGAAEPDQTLTEFGDP